MYSKQAALAQYKKINTESVVEGASPHRLVQMLMAGAIERMSQAKTAYQSKDIEQKGILLGKAISIVAGLQESLDGEKGKDVAENLDNLYDYMQRRLLEANLKNDMEMIDEVSELMATVKSSWDQIEPIH